ncbi:hypothetical protein Ddc_00329 [Ditylenchus destructor]|nr:hypothetical protein Ddc_00329 [Ditylenchus destructor]
MSHPLLRSSQTLSCIAASCRNILMVQRCSFHGSTALSTRFHYKPWNPHVEIKDPKRQDPEFFERAAGTVKLNEYYFDNMKLLWDEIVGSQRALVMKTQDKLIGNYTDYGLPKIDPTKPRLEYRHVEMLRNAPDSVKKIFSIEYGQKLDMTAVIKKEMAEKVVRHGYEKSTPQAKIAWATCCIRYWTAMTEEMLKKNPNRGRPRWFRKRIYTILNYRNTHLKYLNMHDSAEFDRVVKNLKLAYHIPKPHDKDRQYSTLTRKIWTEKMLRKRVDDEKEKKLKALHDQILAKREARMKELNEEMQRLADEKKEIEETLHNIDVKHGKIVEGVVGKYQQKLVEELTEISLQAALFYHPKPDMFRASTARLRENLQQQLKEKEQEQKKE